MIILPSHYFYILLPNYLKQMFLYAQLLLLSKYDFHIPDDYKNEVLLGSHICAVLTPTPPRPSPFCKSYRKKSARMNAKIHISIIIIPIIFWFSFFLHLSNATTAFLSIYFCSDDTTSYPPVWIFLCVKKCKTYTGQCAFTMIF